MQFMECIQLDQLGNYPKENYQYRIERAYVESDSLCFVMEWTTNFIMAWSDVERIQESIAREFPEAGPVRLKFTYEDMFQTEEEIMAELGTPVQVAAELNEQMKEFAYVKSSWRWACLALAVVSGLAFLSKGLMNLLVAAITYAERQSVGIIGGADGPTAIFVTQSPDSAVYSMLMSGLILVMSILGFYYLGHMRKR